MSYLLNNQQKLNEIVFANRNKNYGAYVIRSSYGETVLKALLMTVGLVTIAFATGYYLIDPVPVFSSELITGQDSIYSVPIDLEPEKPVENSQPKKQVRPQEQSSSSEVTNTIISDTVETAAITTTASSFNIQVSNDPDTGIDLPDDGNSGGAGEGAIATATVVEIRSTINVDRVPEFEGGLEALYRFVAANTRFTSDALEAGQGGKIHIQFVVDEEGQVSSVKLLNKLGYGLDEEALRVAGIIPKFKTPAYAGGKPVKMYYHLPINFKIR